jgi:hypothetical protein
MRIIWLRKSGDRQWNFRLIGSREKGTARPDSDWDVLVIPEPPIEIQAKYWIDASHELLNKLGGEGGVLKIIRQAIEFLRRNYGFERGAVDVFVEFWWNGRWQAAQITNWDEERDCWGGWLTDPKLIDPRKAPSVGGHETEDYYILYWSVKGASPEGFKVVVREDNFLELYSKDPDYVTSFPLPPDKNLDLKHMELSVDVGGKYKDATTLIIRIPKVKSKATNPSPSED